MPLRGKRGRRRGVLLVLAALAVGAWLAGLIDFVDRIPRSGNPVDTRATDAIVVLTGGRGRVERGVELLVAGQARLLLISGVDHAVAARELLPDERIPADLRDCCVTLGRVARNTRENAIETAGWADAHGVKSFRLVTADFHMPRSLFEFRRLVPDANIVAEPVGSRNVRLDRWWLWPGTASLLASEFTKYLAARLRGALSDAFAIA